MKNICKFASLTALGLVLAAIPATASAGAACGGCAVVTPMADGASTASTDKAYPLDTCIVSDEKLGEMGEPFVFSHKGQEIKLCCKSCKKKFDKSPETYLKKLAAAPAAK